MKLVWPLTSQHFYFNLVGSIEYIGLCHCHCRLKVDEIRMYDFCQGWYRTWIFLIWNRFEVLTAIDIVFLSWSLWHWNNNQLKVRLLFIFYLFFYFYIHFFIKKKTRVRMKSITLFFAHVCVSVTNTRPSYATYFWHTASLGTKVLHAIHSNRKTILLPSSWH